MNKAKIINIIALTAIAFGTMQAAADARTLQEILSSKTIRLGTIPYPPMTELDPKTGKYSGL